MRRMLDITLPLAVALLVLCSWEWAVAHWQVPVYVLPGPSAIAKAAREALTVLVGSAGS